MNNKINEKKMGPLNERGFKPTLRFAEFLEAEAWEQKPLAKVCTVLQGYGFPEDLQGKKEGKYPFCKVSDVSKCVAENGGILTTAANYIDDEELSKLRAKLIPKGATVFAKIGEALRLNRRALVQKSCLIDNNVTGLKAIDGVADDYFIYLLSQLIDLNDYCGGAVPSVNKSTLEEIKVVIPRHEEQRKVADFLASIDELILAESVKLDGLKTHKKGLMQSLFPAEGEAVPKLRFSEFRDDGEWIETQLGNMGELVNGLTYSPGDVRSSGLLVLRSSNIQNGQISLEDNVYVTPDIKGANLSKANDILICVRNGSKALIGKNALIPEGLPLSTHGAFMTVFRSKYAKFVFQLFQTNAYQKQVDGDLGATINSINGSQLKRYKFYVPKSPDEQQKIADCLTALDELIGAQNRIVEQMKTQKRGLMQQLFPKVDEVQA